MENLFYTLILSLFLTTISYNAWADDDPIDCTEGCTIVTCDGNSCTVWRCDGVDGCFVVGSYTKYETEKSILSGSNVSDKPQPCNLEIDIQSQMVKLCDGNVCTVHVLQGQNNYIIGETKDVESLINKYDDETRYVKLCDGTVCEIVRLQGNTQSEIGVVTDVQFLKH